MGLREKALILKHDKLDRISNLENLYSDKMLSRDELKLLKEEIDGQIKEVTAQLDRKLIDMQTLFEIGKELTSTLNLMDLLQVILFTMMGNFQVSDVAIFSFADEAAEPLGQRGFANLKTFGVSPAFKDRLSKTDEALSLDSLAEFAHEHKELSASNARMLTPVKGKDNLIGFIALGPRMFGEDFGKEERNFIFTMASLAGIALENARLYDELNRKYGELSTLYNVSSVINSTDDYDLVISLILETINTGFGVKKAVLIVLEDEKYLVKECAGLSCDLNGREYEFSDAEKTSVEAKAAAVIDVPESLKEFMPDQSVCLFVPLVSAGQNVGALVISEFEKYRIRETDTDLANLFSVIASQIAPPIITTAMIRSGKESIRDPFAPVLETIGRNIDEAKEFGTDVTFAMLKLANFNKFVELHGGERAHSVFGELADKIRKMIPEEYEIVRYSSNRILFILPAVSDSDLDEFKDTVLSLSKQYFGNIQEMDIGIDLLVAKYPTDAEDKYLLLSRIE